MRRSRSAITPFIGAGLCFSLLALVARQSAPTEEEYGPLMIEIRFIVGDAELHADSRYWPEIGEDVGKLIPMFEQVEAFWTARGTDEAVGFATQALAALNELDVAAIAMNLPGARTAITALRGTCQSCHEAYREETNDGYRIKPGS